MNIKELKEILNKYPDDMLVVVNGYECGYDAIHDKYIKVIDIVDTKQSSDVGRYSNFEFELD